MFIWLPALFLWGLYSKLYISEDRKNIKDSLPIQPMREGSLIKIICVSEPTTFDSA